MKRIAKRWWIWGFKVCLKCGATNPDSYNYCNGCGAPLS